MTRAAAMDGPRAMRIAEDSEAVFEEAIRRGVLSEDPAHANFAGLYMYMHHDAGGAAYFKHRETRAYVTMRPAACKLDPAVKSNRFARRGLGLWATFALAGVFVSGALIDLDRGRPGIGTVRLDELTAEFLSDAVRGAESPEATAEAARAWGTQLEAALDGVAERHGVVLFPAHAVAAGARDYTVEIRAAMAPWAPVTPDTDTPAGDAQDGSGAVQ